MFFFAASSLRYPADIDTADTHEQINVQQTLYYTDNSKNCVNCILKSSYITICLHQLNSIRFVFYYITIYKYSTKLKTIILNVGKVVAMLNAQCSCMVCVR